MYGDEIESKRRGEVEHRREERNEVENSEWNGEARARGVRCATSACSLEPGGVTEETNDYATITGAILSWNTDEGKP